ncbi:hypothetical protein BaRGS_00001903, partial [Batillaria attramentaria]
SKLGIETTSVPKVTCGDRQCVNTSRGSVTASTHPDTQWRLGGVFGVVLGQILKKTCAEDGAAVLA